MLFKNLLLPFVISMSAIGSAAAQNDISDNSDLPPTIKITDIASPDERANVILDLQRSITGMGWDAKVTGCWVMVGYDDQAQAGKDASYGAVCNLVSPHGETNATMCNDRYIGKFTLTPGEYTRQDIGAFIWRNCPPGG